MPRIRTIKPEFFSSPDIAKLDPWARLTFIAMWTWADDFGRGTFNPRELLGYAFPNDEEIGVGEFRRLVGGIRRHVGVKFYRVGGRVYFEIPSWSKHQKTDKRQKRSKHPAPEDGTPWDPEENTPLAAQTPPSVNMSGDSANMSGENSDKSGGYAPRNRGTGEQGNSNTHAQSKIERVLNPSPHETIPDVSNGYPDGFEQWWAAYPRKVGKRKAFAAWFKALKRIPIGDLLEATQTFADFHRADGTDERFIPHPTTWLNRDGWGDKLTPRARPDGPQARQQRTDEEVLAQMLSGPQNSAQPVIDGEIIHQRQIG